MRNPFGSRKTRASRRLNAIRAQVADLAEELSVLDEQIVFLTQVEGDAHTDAVVAGHDVAAREHRAAHSDLQRARRHRDELRAKRDRLIAEQDELLERLLD